MMKEVKTESSMNAAVKDNDGNGDLHRERKDSFCWYKKVIKSNGEDLN